MMTTSLSLVIVDAAEFFVLPGSRFVHHGRLLKESEKLLFGDGKELGKRWQEAYRYFEELHPKHNSDTPVAQAWYMLKNTLKFADRLVKTGK